MPPATGADTIRILVATDSHVGYNERDAVRGDDSWKSFHEVMCLAKEQDVDMVLLAGDLFHDNKPSRKSMYQVMRSLRMNCFGEKPCELEMLSDASENFQGAFNHVNYEDPDINVAIPVFSIHGNHDDPTGEGHLAALDLLQISGLLNYYGRTPESDSIAVKPVLLQKGSTKLALYGMSNVRDERLFRTFRDGNVKFFQPGTQKDDWFNLMSVHQNHHAYTETGYLPENFLPEFMDLVVWGHEHECLIEPRYNPEMGFHVMQPGSSVATSLMPGEAVPKQVAIVSITGKEFKCEPIRLKTVRPFVMKEIVLSEERALKDVWRNDNNRTVITRHLIEIVEKLIADAKTEWLAYQDEEEDEEIVAPLPLIRLRVEYTAPEGGRYDCENPQRFSNRFQDKVANVSDVIQFYRKKATARRTANANAELPEESILAQLSIDTVKVEKLVREFLTAQSLTILPQNSFGDAVSQFVDKDDKHAMEMFVNESLANQVKHLLESNDIEEDEIVDELQRQKSKLEELFSAGLLKKTTQRKAKLKPKPDTWDTDLDGDWADQPGALIHTDGEAEDDEDNDTAIAPAKKPAARGRGKTAVTTRKTATAAPKKAPAPRAGRGKKKVIEDDEVEEDDDVIMIDEDDEEEDEEDSLFVKPAKAQAKKPVAKTTTKAAPKAPAKKAPARSSRQATIDFSQAGTQRSQTNGRSKKAVEPSDDEISDDNDAFETLPPTRGTRSRR
ncbi:DNA repair exonuclease [Mytilinidion resinicola]|uniref:Double-strand break repair protein n=1 Tax=Mytilinidion resinicola TaxID=574789 RepID=A0A6A6YW89_9PEZI|nr:DNA repair exonuclease [Mytilinidion resinicola]KAF2813226.1 DNA repair exonuclease [Mytilinidion resinicola]